MPRRRPLTSNPRVVSGRVICGGDCPMFRRMNAPLVGYCQFTHRPCLVGQLCYAPVLPGATRTPFARFTSLNPKRLTSFAPRRAAAA